MPDDRNDFRRDVRAMAIAMAMQPQHGHLKPRELTYRAARLVRDLDIYVDRAIQRVATEDATDDNDDRPRLRRRNDEALDAD